MSPMRSHLSLQRAVTVALVTMLLLLGMSWPTSAGDTKSLTAILLTARADLPDPNFADALVLVMNNLGPEPVGIIVNRPTRMTVAKLFPDLERLAQVHDKVYFGGPVEIESVWFLLRAVRPPKHAVQVLDGVYLSGSPDLLFQLLSRDKPMQGLRIFIGHSGWGPGQLETEISRGDWALKRADSNTIFNGKSEHPWPPSEAGKPNT
jgi:putative transcriptional regulator